MSSFFAKVLKNSLFQRNAYNTTKNPIGKIKIAFGRFSIKNQTPKIRNSQPLNLLGVFNKIDQPNKATVSEKKAGTSAKMPRE